MDTLPIPRTVTRFNVEAAFGTTTTLYLGHIPGIGMRWSVDPDAAWEYQDEDEAQDDADQHGGEVFKFERLTRRTDPESFTGHNTAARLERALQEAAE
jgi:hypothetical protein